MIDTVDPKSMYLHWHAFNSSSPIPCAREMHSTSVHDNTLIITGGRDGTGTLLQDVWILCLQEVIPDHNSNSQDNFLAVLTWEESAVKLPEARCAHAAAFCEHHVYLYGGFTLTGIASDMLELDIYKLDSTWKTCSFDVNLIPTRFGHTMCTLSKQALASFQAHEVYGNLLPMMFRAGKIDEMVGGMLLFGGVDAEQDFGDIWMIRPSQAM
jgi:hypothetical protein